MGAVCVCPDCGSHHSMMLPSSPEERRVTISKDQYEAMMAGVQAFLTLGAYIDFNEPISDEMPMIFTDVKDINKHFEECYAAVNALRAVGIRSK
jgi:hypothetical protein